MPIGGGASASASGVPSGTIIHVAHANDPGDSVGQYLECNGQNVSRTTYATLYNKVLTTWGVGDGSTTFGLPDARRRSPVGKGGVGTATLANTVGSTGGEESHVQSLAELRSHSHNLQFADGSGGAGGTPIALGSSDTASVNPGTSGAGSSTAFNVYHPSYICGVWIKT